MELKELASVGTQFDLPTGWDVLPISQLGQIQGGRQRSPNAAGHPTKYLRVANVFDGYIDGTDVLEMPFTPEEVQRFLLRDGDILLNEGQSLDLVGRSAIYRGEPPAACFQNTLIRFRSNDRTAPEYAQLVFQSFLRSGVFASIAMQTTSIAHLGVSRFAALPMPVPPRREQQAIAEALSDADALIESLSLLLAKKRQIKQGAMQELLTGKKRLPGFTGGWPLKSLGELFQFSGGLSASRDQLSERGHLYLHYGDIHVSTKTFIDVAVEGGVIPRLDVSLAKVSPTSLLSDGDVVFVDASEDDEGVSKHVVISNPEGLPFIAGLHTIVAKQRQQLLERSYLRYCFQARAVKDQFKFYAVGTKVSGVSKRNIAKISLPVPTYVEQEAIGELLASMDEEITALERKLSKARQFKQGMMQALLTGRIRLVKPASNVIPLPTKPAVANPPQPQPAHNRHFDDAVILGVLAQAFGSESFPLGRFRRTKFSYLLHRYREQHVDRYLMKAAGPYNPEVRYGGAEKIAVRKRYVSERQSGQFKGFVAGDNVAEAQQYFSKWLGEAALRWLEQFRKRTNPQLELLTTVDRAIVELAAEGKDHGFINVRQLIATEPEWVPKLSRELFSDENIERAITECRQLFG